MLDVWAPWKGVNFFNKYYLFFYLLVVFFPLPIRVFIFAIYHFIFLSLSSLPFLPLFLNFFVLYLFVLYSFYPSFFLYHSASISLVCYVVWKHRLPASFFICFVFPSIHSSYSSSFILPFFLYSSCTCSSDFFFLPSSHLPTISSLLPPSVPLYSCYFLASSHAFILSFSFFFFYFLLSYIHFKTKDTLLVKEAALTFSWIRFVRKFM